MQVNKKLLVCMGIFIGLVSNRVLRAQEIRTPWSLWRGSIHYPASFEDKKWRFDTWSGAYYKTADKAFTQHGWDATSLTKLFLGKDEFRVIEIFENAGSDINCFQDNPYIITSKISPQVDYHERGLYFGTDFHRKWDNNKLRTGLRVRVPWRSARTERIGCERTSDRQNNMRAFKKEKIDDVLIGAGGDLSYAYRLDWLGALCKTDFGDESLVDYDCTVANEVHVKIAGKDVSKLVNFELEGGMPGAGDVEAQPVALRKSVDRCPPDGQFAAGATEVVATAGLAGDGLGLCDGDLSKFDPATNYDEGGLANCLDAQSCLYVVPTYNDVPETDIPGAFNGIANDISDIVENRLQLINQDSAEEFLECHGVCLDGQRNDGIGDIQTEIYASYDFSDNLYGEAGFIVSWPIAEEIQDPRKVFKMVSGNNGHWEVMPRIELGWEANNWFALKTDLLYSFVLCAPENRAGSFKCATVKNIGPTVSARVSWAYFLGHVDATFFHPKNKDLGVDIGYELYAKTEDNIRFKCCPCPGPKVNGNGNGEVQVQAGMDFFRNGSSSCGSSCSGCSSCCPKSCPKTSCHNSCGSECGSCPSDCPKDECIATDFLGRERVLDSQILKKRTDVIAHKVRTEIFRRFDYAEYFFGGSYTFAGRNAPREMDVHGGIVITW